MARHDIDLQALAASTDRFGRHPMARMRQLIEVQMRRVNGLPQEPLAEGEELRLRRVVLEAQLRTLRAWSATWRGRLPQGYQEQASEAGDREATHSSNEQAAVGDVSAEERERIAAFGAFLNS